VTEPEEFEARNREFIARMGQDTSLAHLTREWFNAANTFEYSYHFSALSRPIIQYPQDIVAMQELIWSLRPDLIVETGIARGGSLVLSASMLALLDYCDAVTNGHTLDPLASNREVIGVDIEIRPHNRAAVEAHPLAHKIRMLEGSSTDKHIVDEVWRLAQQHDRILVCLDSNHTHEHAMAELEAYAPLVSEGSYCVVFDTVIEDLPPGSTTHRPWAKGNNPKTAVWEYLRRLDATEQRARDGARLRFEIDKMLESKLLITVAPDGYLKRV
jgi:cephalosporin hydroxylase